VAKTSWSHSDTHADSEPNANWNRKPNSDAHAYGNCVRNTKTESDTQRDSYAAATSNANAASYATELRCNTLVEEQKTRQGQRTALSLPLSI
jgi:hypothetical protein